MKELDFELELQNGAKTKENFIDDDRIYIPTFYKQHSWKRVLTMEFIDHTIKIDKASEILEKFGKEMTTEYVCKSLIDIFAKQIFLYGLVHVDGHPGNILVREHPLHPKRPQIVLLDHGHYCHVSEEFRLRFWRLWYALCTFDNNEIKRLAFEFGVNEYYRYLPMIFTHRTLNSKTFIDLYILNLWSQFIIQFNLGKKKLGESFTQEEKDYMKSRNDLDFDSIGFLLQKLPWEIILIFKATHLVSMHNKRFSFNHRMKFLRFTDYWILGLLLGNYSSFRYWTMKLSFMIKVLLFEYFPSIFRYFFNNEIEDKADTR